MRCFYRRGNLSAAAALGGLVAISSDTGGVGRQSRKAPGENCSQWRCYGAIKAPGDCKVTEEEPRCQMPHKITEWLRLEGTFHLILLYSASVSTVATECCTLFYHYFYHCPREQQINERNSAN